MAEGSSTAPALAVGSAFKSLDFRLYQTARLMVIVEPRRSRWRGLAGVCDDPLRDGPGVYGVSAVSAGLFFMLAAGHVADRYDRRLIILYCYGLQAACTAGLLALSLSREFMASGHIWPIYAVLVGIGLGRAFSGPAASAMLPSLVPKEHFVNAVTWGATIYQISNMSGPAVGGLLFVLHLTGGLERWNGAPIVYAFTLVMLLGFMVLVGMIRARVAVTEKKAFNMKTVLAGLEYVWRAKLLLGSISLDLFAVMLGGAVALLPIFATDILHAGRAGWACCGRCQAWGAGGEPDDAGEANQATRRLDDALLRGDIWRGDGGVRAVEEHLGEHGRAGVGGGKRYGECGGAVEHSCNWRLRRRCAAGERGELAVYRGVERVRRV